MDSVQLRLPSVCIVLPRSLPPRIAGDQRPVEEGMRTSAAHLRSAERVP